MTKTLEQYLLEAEGKAKGELPAENPYREIGFDADKKRLGWLRVIPFSSIKEALKAVLGTIGDKKYFVFVGMGGSINGIKALISLFKTKFFFTLDNLDPQALEDILRKIKDKDKTLVIPISKSGTTLETQLLAATLKELFGDKWRRHFLWLTDPTSFEKLDSLGWTSTAKVPIQFDGATDIGGRFSCPHTIIFFLPLFLLLDKDFRKLEKIYNTYLSFQKTIRKEAYKKSGRYRNCKCVYFHPQAPKKMGEKLSSWIVQLFQESLGSKRKGLPVKTVGFSEKTPAMFLSLHFGLRINNVVSSLMAQMYFFEIFIAFYSAFKKINFVTQDFVEHYKCQMRKLESEKEQDIPVLNLSQIIKKVKERLTQNHKFIEVVFYGYSKPRTLLKVKTAFSRAFSQKVVFVFTGSDWNHHSYQAAFADQETFYVLLVPQAYKTVLPPFSAGTISKNITTLKMISRATYLTLQDKSLLFSFAEG
jgi:hypothetical protein